MNYFDTFIQVAPDYAAKAAVVPVEKGGKKTIAVLEYELLSSKPYHYTQEEVLFTVDVQRKGVPAKELKTRRNQLWKEFFSKPRACMRASPLPKSYGWGVHFDAEGKAAIYGVESKEYRKLAGAKNVKQVFAMRNARPKS